VSLAWLRRAIMVMTASVVLGATAPDGRPAADVTFTSRQQPQDGPDGESCTSWHLTMFFDEHGRSYTIGAPPGDYHAAYQACS
jgi:hypothetical protein